MQRGRTSWAIKVRRYQSSLVGEIGIDMVGVEGPKAGLEG
jgi:hypothetical protein